MNAKCPIRTPFRRYSELPDTCNHTGVGHVTGTHVTQDHRTVEAGRDLWKSSGLCSGRATQDQLPSTISRWLLNISKEVEEAAVTNLHAVRGEAEIFLVWDQRCMLCTISEILLDLRKRC